MSDLIEHLRRRLTVIDGSEGPLVNPDGPKAADRIEALSAECEALREALEGAEALLEEYHPYEDLECCATDDAKYRDRLFERNQVRTTLQQTKESARASGGR